MTQAPVRRVAVHHRIHVTGRNAKEQVRLTQLHKGIFILPIRLGDNADPEALRLQQATDHRHTKTRVIDIGITGNEDNVATVPAQLIHLRP